MRMGGAWCQDAKIESEVKIRELCVEAVNIAMVPSEEEEAMGILYTKRSFQKKVVRHNLRAEGRLDPKRSLWQRLTSCVRAPPEFYLAAK